MWLNKGDWLNELWCGNNLEVLKNIPDESVDLIYIDPPFFSNRHYEVIWGNGAELRAFGDRWKGGIEHYVGWMVERLEELKRILKPTGSIYVHLDWHAVHYIKIEMDRLFGYENFQNDISWCYNVGGKSKKRWARKHDSILFYTKSKNYFFDGKAVGIKRDTGEKSFGGKMGIDDDGRRYHDKLVKATGKYYRYYLDEPKIPEDWWTDLNSLQSQDKERIGYPTQKPEALLERIIKASTKEGDIVLDAFCGCGTTIAVAERLKRKWVGIDVSPIAVDVMTERLIKMEKKMGKKLEDFITYGLPEKTIAHLRKMSGFEFEEFIIQQIDGKITKKTGDKGIDGYNKDGVPIEAKNWEKKVGREVIDKFQSAIRRVKQKKGQIYAMAFTPGAHEEVAKLRKDGIEIELIEMKEFLIEKYDDHTHRK